MRQYACSFVVETVHTCSLITYKKRPVAIECVILKQEKKLIIDKEETSVIQINHSVIGDIVIWGTNQRLHPQTDHVWILTWLLLSDIV